MASNFSASKAIWGKLDELTRRRLVKAGWVMADGTVTVAGKIQAAVFASGYVAVVPETESQKTVSKVSRLRWSNEAVQRVLVGAAACLVLVVGLSVSSNDDSATDDFALPELDHVEASATEFADSVSTDNTEALRLEVQGDELGAATELLAVPSVSTEKCYRSDSRSVKVWFSEWSVSGTVTSNGQTISFEGVPLSDSKYEIGISDVLELWRVSEEMITSNSWNEPVMSCTVEP